MKLVVGITGSIGSGKSTVAEMFAGRGFAVQDADKVVHEIYESHDATISKIKTEFIDCVIDGKVDRDKLKQIIKANPEKRKVLEDIVHPAVASFREEFVSKNDKCVLDVPLLFEAGVDEYCDVIIVTHCDDKVRRKRVIAKGVDGDIFEMLNNAQMTQQEKISKSDIDIDTNRPLVIIKGQVSEIIDQLEKDFFDA